MPLRESDSLLIYLASSPTHMCVLFQTVKSFYDFIATFNLSQLPFEDYVAQENQVANKRNQIAIVSIIQKSAVKSITDIDLPLCHATHEKMVADLGSTRSREAYLAAARARQMQRELDDE